MSTVLRPRFFLLVVLAVSSSQAVAADKLSARGAGRADPQIDALFAHWDQPGSPGCAVAVSRDGELLYSRGYGYANLDHDIPITPQTLFDVASVTKQFVAASLNMLALENRLSLDDDIRKHLPELRDYEQTITLRHMLYHTSGLRDYLTLFPLAGRDDYYPISHRQILAMMARQRALNFEPGEQYEYSNTAYMLLAQVIERRSGQSLGDFVQEHIFDPRGMHHSVMYDNFEQIMPGRATGYVGQGDLVRMTHNFNFDVPGDGQMYATVEDLVRWDNYLHGADPPAYSGRMTLPGVLNSGQPLQVGQGLFLDDYRGAETVYHTGSSWGFRSVVERFVAARLVIAIACNDDQAYPRRIALRIADYLLADELDPPALAADAVDEESDTIPGAAEAPAAGALSAAQREALSGEYYSAELDAIYRVAQQREGIVVQIEQELPIPLRPLAPDWLRFEFQPRGWSEPTTVDLSFRRSPAGDVSGFLLSTPTEHDLVFEKVVLPATGDLL